MFTWNFKVRLLGYYLLLLVIIQAHNTLSTGAGPSSWGFRRLEFFLLVATDFSREAVLVVGEFARGLEAAWLVAIALLLIIGKPWLRTYIWVESIVTLPAAYFAIGLFLTGPSFHTGSREDHMRMLFMLLVLFLLPVTAAFFLRLQQNKLDKKLKAERLIG